MTGTYGGSRDCRKVSHRWTSRPGTSRIMRSLVGPDLDQGSLPPGAPKTRAPAKESARIGGSSTMGRRHDQDSRLHRNVLPGDSLCSSIPHENHNWVTVWLQFGYSFSGGRSDDQRQAADGAGSKPSKEQSVASGPFALNRNREKRMLRAAWPRMSS